jgi:urease beta subunit
LSNRERLGSLDLDTAQPRKLLLFEPGRKRTVDVYRLSGMRYLYSYETALDAQELVGTLIKGPRR